MASLRSLARLSSAQRAWFFAGLAHVAASHAIIRVVPYSIWSAWLRPRRTERPIVATSAREIGAGIARASRVIPRSTCLVQAIAAQLTCRLVGYRTKIALGVAATDEGAMRAHAWVTASDGAVVVGWIPELGDYVPFATERPLRSLR